MLVSPDFHYSIILEWPYSLNNLFKICVCVLYVKSPQLCLTLRSFIDYSPPGFSVYGIRQARILEWVAMLSFRGSA